MVSCVHFIHIHKIKCVIDIRKHRHNGQWRSHLKIIRIPSLLIQLSLVITDSNVAEISFPQLSFKVKHEKWAQRFVHHWIDFQITFGWVLFNMNTIFRCLVHEVIPQVLPGTVICVTFREFRILFLSQLT